MNSVDGFVKQNGIEKKISFIKVDVQGFETKVCQGMETTLKQNPDIAVAMEYHPEGMIKLGFHPKKMLDFFEDRNFNPYLLDNSGNLRPCEYESLDKNLGYRGYTDILFTKRTLNL